MEDEDKIQIEYLGEITPMKKYPEYDEFISQLTYQFYLTDNMKKEISLNFIDEDGDSVVLDQDSYSDSLSSQKIIVTIPEKSSNTEGIKEQVKIGFEQLNKDVTEFKKKLKGIAQSKMKEKLKQIDERHKKELNELKEKYDEKLKEIKKGTQDKLKDLLIKIEEKSIEIMNNDLVQYKNHFEKEIDNITVDQGKSLENKYKEVNLENLEKKQNEVDNVLQTNQKELDKHLES